MPIGILHPGQMGAAVGAQAVAAGARVLWCPEGRSGLTAERARKAGLEPVGGLKELLGQCETVLSIVPPAVAEQVAGEVAAHDYQGTYVEANAVSPESAVRIAKRFPDGICVDGGIIGPPPRPGYGSRLYLSGPGEAAERVRECFANTALTVRVLNGPIGKASALKMSYAAFQKASRALAAVSIGLADRHGVRAELQAEADRMGSSPLAEPDYLPSAAARAWRWGPEMREVAAAMTEAGLPADFALAAEQVFAHWDGSKDRWDVGLDEVLDLLTERADDSKD